MRKYFLVIVIYLFLILLINFVSAYTITYNFNSTYQGINMFARSTYTLSGGCSSYPPLDGPIPSCTGTDMTTNSKLDLDDGIAQTDGGYTSTYGTHLFIANITNISINDITLINWTHNTDGTARSIRYYLWDGTKWVLSGSTLSANYYFYNWTNNKGYFNYSSNNNSFLLVESLNGNDYTSTDYVSLTITYTPNVTSTLSSPIDNYNTTSLTNLFTCNSSVTSDTLNNVTLFIYNSDGTLNQTNSSSITGVFNSTVLSATLNDGNYSWNCLTNSSLGVSNFASSNRTFRIDTTAPNLNIIYPNDYDSFDYKTNININYTISDNGVGLSSCKWSNSSGTYNYSITCGENITVSEANDGSYSVTIWANDTLNNIANKTIHYVISSSAPAIILNYPINNQWLNFKNNIYFNFTATDSNGLSSCELWSNWTGTWVKNYTWVSPNSGIMNYTNVNLTDGYYKWNVWCNDTTNTAGFASINKTFGIDTIYPTINNILINTIPNSQTFNFNATISDLNLVSCKYSIFNSTNGYDGTNINQSFTCNSLTSATTTDFGTYNLTIYAIDLAGNENSSTSSFTTSQSTLSVAGGGGGSSKVSVIAIKSPGNLTIFNELQRAILYSRIRDFCINQTICKINNMTGLMSNLLNKQVTITLKELNDFLNNYNNNELESVQVDQLDVITYNLFTGVLNIKSNTLKLNPSNIDTFSIILFSKEFKYMTNSNKNIANISINGELGISANLISQSSYQVILNVQNTDFSFKNFKGLVTVTDQDGLVVYQNVNIRVINLLNPLSWLEILALPIIALTFFYRNKLRKVLKLK